MASLNTPDALLAQQLRLLSDRADRDVASSATRLVAGYRSQLPGEVWLAALDGHVVIQGPMPHSWDSRLTRQQLFVELQKAGFAVAPVNTSLDAAVDPHLPPPMQPSRKETFRPSRRLRVLDVTHLVAGPFATYLLALLGMDVIKVERPETGDGLRLGAPCVFANLNRCKPRITLNLSHAIGRELLQCLTRSADLIVENLRGLCFRTLFPKLEAPLLSLPAIAAQDTDTEAIVAMLPRFTDCSVSAMSLEHQCSRGPISLPELVQPTER